MKKVLLMAGLVLMMNTAFRTVSADQIKIFDSRQEWIKHTFVTALDPQTWGDYADGDLYIRYYIIDKPSDIEVMPMICIWQGQYAEPDFCETCTKMGYLVKFGNEGQYYQKYAGPTNTSYWQNPYGTGYKKDEPSDRVMHQWWVKKDGKNVVLRADQGDTYDYGDGVEEHIPIDFSSTAILVKKGTTFYPPADWTDCPDGWGCGQGIPQTPFGGGARSLPGKVEAEDYDNGGEGVAYHDGTGDNKYGEYRGDDVDITVTEDGGSGYKVKAEEVEWLEYTVNVTGGTYDVVARVSTPRDGGNAISIKVGGKDLGTRAIPNTGAWETFTDVIYGNVTLTGGEGQILRVDTEGIGWNINYIEVVPAGTASAIEDIRTMPALGYKTECITIYRMDGTPAADGVSARTADLAPGIYLVVDRSRGNMIVQKMMHIVK